MLLQSFSTHNIMTPPKKKTVIIDTDSGFDDILAIFALVNNPTISVPFISTVGGIHECPNRASKFLDMIYPTATVVAGISTQDVSNKVPSWLLEYRRKLDTIVSPNSGDVINEDVTLELHTSLQHTLRKYPDQSIDLLCRSIDKCSILGQQ